MARAQYTYELVDVNGKKGIAITDLNQGQVSVTNDIENVVNEIAKIEGIDPTECTIVYKDAEGVWDGWDAKSERFVFLNAKHWAHAVNKVAKMKREGNYKDPTDGWQPSEEETFIPATRR